MKPTPPPSRSPNGAQDTRQDRQPLPPEPDHPEPVQPVSLENALATFGRWLPMDDVAPVLAVPAVVVANRAAGDPVWLLLVGPPSGGKTEILLSVSGLDYVVLAATITEAALLSGTSKRERAHDATGGLLRQVDDFGILLSKDFTSVLSQNRDTAKAAMAALREVYDGSWHRPVGTDGGRVLTWTGKCGFLGGVTPSYDRYSVIVNTLGDRYLLLRLPDADPKKQAKAALAQAEHEEKMREELAAAMTGLIAGADPRRVHEKLDDETVDLLVQLASFAARARTGVERDGYSSELLVLPQPEGPARLVKALRRLYGGLGAIGADTGTRWHVLIRVAVDCVPAVRMPLMWRLLDNHEPKRTADIAAQVGMVTKTASRILDDLALLGIATRTKKSSADNSPDMWEASDWLRQHGKNWLLEVRQKCTYGRKTEGKGGGDAQRGDGDRGAHPANSALRTFLSHSDGVECNGNPVTNGRQPSTGPTDFELPTDFALPTGPGRCRDCGFHEVTQGHRDGCPRAGVQT